MSGNPGLEDLQLMLSAERTMIRQDILVTGNINALKGLTPNREIIER
jgi:hypothetical protein